MKTIATAAGRARILEAELSPAGRRVLAVGLAALEHIEAEISMLDRDLSAMARREPGCRALRTLYGVGLITSVAILTELGDCRAVLELRSCRALRGAGHLPADAGYGIRSHVHDPRR